jgi:hypothetical protein
MIESIILIIGLDMIVIIGSFYLHHLHNRLSEGILALQLSSDSTLSILTTDLKKVEHDFHPKATINTPNQTLVIIDIHLTYFFLVRSPPFHPNEEYFDTILFLIGTNRV